MNLCSLALAAMIAADPGVALPDLTFKDTRDNVGKLSDATDAKAIVIAFLGCECPVNTAVMPTLTKLAAEFDGKGVTFIGVYPNAQDSLADVTEHARKHGIKFRTVKDFDAKIADLAGATRTPEFVVLDAKRVVRYRGRIDDQFGVQKSGQSFARPKATRNDLRDAIEAVRNGKEAATATTEVLGCLIGKPRKAKSSEVTYAEHVAPILFKNCTSCHRPGEIGPFSLLTYDDAAGWSEMIKEVVREHRMPPWHADAKHGTFANDRSMSDADIDTLVRWVDEGAPAGDLAKAPKPPKFADGWAMGQPDRVFTMPKPYTVPAKGTIEYQWMTIDPKLTEDVWATSIEIRPGARTVVHHVLAFVLPPGERRPSERTEAGYFAAYAPGRNPEVFPAGYGKKIPAGSKIVFQMHYTANGTKTDDQTSIGVKTAKGPLKEIDTLGIAFPRLYLPAGKADVEIKSAHKLTQDITLYAMMPHTHLRGKAFRFDVDLPDGSSEVLLNVARYDFNWQAAYQLAEPKKLPKGATIRCTAIYDNSKENPNNPDATQNVRWGPQTWEEMMIGYFDYAPSSETPEPSGGTEAVARRKAFLLGLYVIYDKNKDGKLEVAEVPAAQQKTFKQLLNRFDANEDGVLSKDEIPGLKD